MAKCVIFCAGEFESLLEPILPDDLVIAADGGMRHTQRLGVDPGAILGDFDSLGYIPNHSKVFPCEKDDTDAMLAIRFGLDAGHTEFLIYGGIEGPRLEHTVANFQALQFLAERGAKGYLVGKRQIVSVLAPGNMIFPENSQGYISVFCMGKDATGVCLEGLQYPLKDASLTASFPLGVSNQFLGSQARIQLNQGYLLVVWERENGLPNVFPLN